MLSSTLIASSLIAAAAAAPLAHFVEAPEKVYGDRFYSNETFGLFNVKPYEIAHGNCNITTVSTDYVASVKTNSTDLSQVCGMQIAVTNVNNGKTVLAQIVDECLECAYNYLILSPSAYGQVSERANFTGSYVFSNEEPKSQSDNVPASSPKASPQESPKYSEPSSKKEEDYTPKQTPTTTSTKDDEPAYTPKTTSKKEEDKPVYTPKTTSKKEEEYTEKKEEYTPKTTQQEQPKETPKQASSNSGSGGSYHGQATYFYQNGVAGNCGAVSSDSSYIVAVNSAQYSGSCGRSVRITNTNTGESITARCADQCPSCGYGSLDLSVGAFSALSSLSNGVFPIAWSWA